MRRAGVPLIDIAPFLNGSATDKRTVAEEVGRACEGIGFFSVVGHGVPQDLIATMRAVSRAFFDLPLPAKMTVARSVPGRLRGYLPLGGKSLSYTLDKAAPPDAHEAFSMGPVDVPDDEYHRRPAASSYFAPNVWPPEPAEMPLVWSEYYRVMEKLAAQLMEIFAQALGLPEAFFTDKIDKHISVLNVLNYPAQTQAPLPGQLRAGAHSDYGSLTILRTDDAGLQVRTRRDEWVDVETVADSFVVNIGDLMMHWTNDRWISTLHRVVNPPRDDARARSRLSLVFFHQPNYDAMISCLESCRGPGNPAKYPPISSGEHMLMKVRKAGAGRGNAAAG
jgi:isopenicillin N synthase-like dioxygenase